MGRRASSRHYFTKVHFSIKQKVKFLKTIFLCFILSFSGYPVLLKPHQNFILSIAHLDPYIMIESDYQNYQDFDNLGLYGAYISKGLWSKRENIDTIQDMTVGFEDTLQMPLQPLSDHLESSTYEGIQYRYEIKIPRINFKAAFEFHLEKKTMLDLKTQFLFSTINFCFSLRKGSDQV